MPFGYVAQSEFDAEHELRLKAEAREESLREQVQTLNELLRDERKDKSEMFDRFMPKPHQSIFDNGEVLRMTADEILAVPAGSKREMVLRQQAANAARAREIKEAQDKDMSARHAAVNEAELNESEKQQVSTVIDEMITGTISK